MSKRVKRSTKPTEVAPSGPHDWIFASTAGLEGPLSDLAAKTIHVVLTRLRESGPLMVAKSGPGVVTIRIPEDEATVVPAPGDLTTPKGSAYKRMALAGGEKLEIVDFALGKRDGIIIRMLASKGALLGVDKDVTCEVPLSGLVKAFTLADGGSIGELFKDEMDKIGKNVDEFADRLTEMQAEAEAKEAEQERLTKLRYIEEKSTEYADKNWGGW